MSNKLKCPFCQTELEDAGIHSAGFYFWCTNCYMKQKEKNDNYTASPRIWQALIQAKQDLEIARKALEELWQATHYDTDGYLGKTIQHALEQITHDNSEKANSVENKESE